MMTRPRSDLASLVLWAFSVLSLPAQEAPRTDGPATQDGAQPERILPMPIPRALILHKGERSLEIDGSLQDWPALPPIALDDGRQLSGTAFGAFRSRDDLAAKVFALWDADALWLGIVVLDDWHVRLRQDSPRISEIPPADAVSIRFDPARDTFSLGADPGRAEDSEFWLADVEGQGRKVVFWDRYRSTARFADAAECVVQRDAERRLTIYEARLPWAEILPHGDEAEARKVFDLQIEVDDFDEPTDPIAQTRLGWNFGMGPRIDPGLMGSAMLADVTPADLGDGGFPMPPFPDPPAESDPPPIPPLEHWLGLLEGLEDHPPERVGAGTVDPSSVGGVARRTTLESLDRHCAAFPRADFLGYQNRIHRRMNREAEGIAQRGLPLFWQRGLDRLADRLREPPERGFRVHRLPQGGVVVQSKSATVAIDPAGYRVERVLDPLVDLVILTTPQDPTRRNDPLSLRLLSGERRRPVLMHLAIHLPGLSAEEIPLVQNGQEHVHGDLTVRALGHTDGEGRVSTSFAYWLRLADGSDLLVAANVLDEVQVDAEDPIEALLLSPRHPRGRPLAHRLAPGVVLVDEALQCAIGPGAIGRVPLQAAWDFQDGLRPLDSVLLAPGDSVDISPR